MNKKYALPAIAMVAVIMGMSAFAPAMATPNEGVRGDGQAPGHQLCGDQVGVEHDYPGAGTRIGGTQHRSQRPESRGDTNGRSGDGAPAGLRLDWLGPAGGGRPAGSMAGAGELADPHRFEHRQLRRHVASVGRPQDHRSI